MENKKNRHIEPFLYNSNLKSIMNKKVFFAAALLAVGLNANAQELKEGYIQWLPEGESAASFISRWSWGSQVTPDDEFFISRVKPHYHFRNEATQVRLNLNKENDKRLLAWLPFNGTSEKNGLPDGIFDSEVFSMWNYVDHWGNWTAPLGRIPGAFMDAAHKNGVAVSSVIGIPWGGISLENQQILSNLANIGGKKMAEYMYYYGQNGLGYNSEYEDRSGTATKLASMHQAMLQELKDIDPLAENIWYDGTNKYGNISFDQGLDTHNDEIFKGASLFFNYNTAFRVFLLKSSVDKAKQMNKNPLYLYSGMNMQGNEGGMFSNLEKHPISIGLWGAHSNNMFWESRGEKGSSPEVQQRTYMLRTERFFSSGQRNPVNDLNIVNNLKYHADNYNFHGMSRFMSARSSLKWDLGTEPFITYFNLGNGKFFNWMGERQNDNSWYNIGVQDYLPTWRWWFATKLLGRTTAEVPQDGLDAEFVWDDAYVGGSTLSIHGTTGDEYLHLFKTEFDLKQGDVITVKYKHMDGTANAKLVLTAKGEEQTAINENNLVLLEDTHMPDDEEWIEKKFTVKGSLAGKTIALVALHFENAQNMKIYLGEFSIVRNKAVQPNMPKFKGAKLLGFNNKGVDGKIYFSMDNNISENKPVYNIDVNTGVFKLWAQQKGKDPVFMGITTSWAGMFYSVPVDFSAENKGIRLGVSATSIDYQSDSEIAWSDYMTPENYEYNDDIKLSQNVIKPNETFTISFVDANHEDATWEIKDSKGDVKLSANGTKIEGSLEEVGGYTVVVTGPAGKDRENQARTFNSFLQISGKETGAMPKIYTLTANEKEANINVEKDDVIQLAYTGREADGTSSQGLNLKEKPFGVKMQDLGLYGGATFSVAFWMNINSLADGETQLLNIRSKADRWPKTDWGWIWTTINDKGELPTYTFRGTDWSNNDELRYRYKNSKVATGVWNHFVYVFDYKGGQLHSDFYINGEKQDIVSWDRNTANGKGDPGFKGNVYNITDKMVLAIGGNAHDRSGINGQIDNFQIWDKAMTADDVKLSMGNLDPNNLPANIVAYWDFEQPAVNNLFTSTGSKQIKGGMHDYEAAGSEGQGNFRWIKPTPISGCPLLAGAYKVVTRPTWKTRKAIVQPISGTDTEGKATVAYANDGEYNVQLTLTNDYGSDSKTFQVITVGKTDGINNTENGDMRTYVVDRTLFLELETAGNYDVNVYTAAGALVAKQNMQATAGTKMKLTLGNTGVYVVKITRDGKTLPALKLMMK